MMRTWGWVGQYVVAILLALLLGAILGNLSLFQETALGDTKLNASRVVQFMGYGGALVLLWLLGQRAAMQLPEDGRGLSFLRHVIAPLTESLKALGRGGQSADPQSSFSCPTCRRPVADGMKFCGHCGTSVG